MHRTQLLLPRELHRRATEAARARRMSLGHLPRLSTRSSWASRSRTPTRIVGCPWMSITTSTERPGGLAGGDERPSGRAPSTRFAVMEELGLDRFLGFDEDFVRAGFIAYR